MTDAPSPAMQAAREARERWSRVKPEAVVGGSDAQSRNVFSDCRQSVLTLASAIEAQAAENERLREALTKAHEAAEVSECRIAEVYDRIVKARDIVRLRLEPGSDDLRDVFQFLQDAKYGLGGRTNVAGAIAELSRAAATSGASFVIVERIGLPGELVAGVIQIAQRAQDYNGEYVPIRVMATALGNIEIETDELTIAMDRLGARRLAALLLREVAALAQQKQGETAS